MGRAPCCDKSKVKRGPWSPQEDSTLKDYIQKHGTGGNWIALPQKAGLMRCGKSCRLRWLNYLRPDIKLGGFTEEEDRIILSLYISIGSRWSLIASHLPGRTDNDVKNHWNTKLKKRLKPSSTQFMSTTSNNNHIFYTKNPMDFRSSISSPRASENLDGALMDFTCTTSPSDHQMNVTDQTLIVPETTPISTYPITDSSYTTTSFNTAVSSSQEHPNFLSPNSFIIANDAYYASWSGDGSSTSGSVISPLDLMNIEDFDYRQAIGGDCYVPFSPSYSSLGFIDSGIIE